MCDTFYAAIVGVIPESWSKIVYDRFYVMQHVRKAVEIVRKQEHAYLLRTSDQRLSGTRHLWSYSDENLPEQRREQLEKLKADELVTGRAWALKEFLRTRWNCPSRLTAQPIAGTSDPRRTGMNHILTASGGAVMTAHWAPSGQVPCESSRGR